MNTGPSQTHATTIYAHLIEFDRLLQALRGGAIFRTAELRIECGEVIQDGRTLVHEIGQGLWQRRAVECGGVRDFEADLRDAHSGQDKDMIIARRTSGGNFVKMNTS